MTDPAHSSPRTPRTAAGQRLLDLLAPIRTLTIGVENDKESAFREGQAVAIAAIETEAAAELREAVRLWVEHRDAYDAAVAAILPTPDIEKAPRTGPYWDAVRLYATQRTDDEQRLRAALVDRHLREGEAAGGE